MSDPREAKLPKWAQAELASLRDKLADLKDDFEEYADKAMPSDVSAVVNPYDTHPRPAAREGETVRFLLDGLGGFRYIDVRVTDRDLDVMGSTGLRIAPAVTNHLTLSLTTDY